MIGRKAAVGLTLLCALVFPAFAASSASAEVAGTTAFTCVPMIEGVTGFKDAHCAEKAANQAEVKFVHKEIKQDETTKIHGTNEKTKNNTSEHTPAMLETAIAGISIKITCTKVFAHGNQTNKLEPAPSKEHWIHGEKITVHYTECELNLAKCEVENKTVLAEGITATTTELGENIRFKPEVGNTFVTFNIVNKAGEQCSITGKFPVVGSLRAQLSGATLNFTHKAITGEKTLTFGGQPAGLSGSITVSQAAETAETGKTGNPISVATVET